MKTLKVACLYNCKWGCGQFHMWFLSRWKLVLSNWLLWLTWPMSVLVIIGLCQHFRIACDQLDHRDTSCCCPEYWSSGLNSFNLYHFTIFPKRLLPASPCQAASATCSQWEQIRNDLIFQCGREWSAHTSHSDWRCHPLKITQISNPLSSFLKGIVTICFLSHLM